MTQTVPILVIASATGVWLELVLLVLQHFGMYVS